jgi:hypothetical protein
LRLIDRGAGPSRGRSFTTAALARTFRATITLLDLGKALLRVCLVVEYTIARKRG